MNQIFSFTLLQFTTFCLFLKSFSYQIMPPFRFHIPFFSYGSPSRLSSGTSSPSPPPTPPSRPPFRPAGIAQPSKPATSPETKSKVAPSLSRAKSNVTAIGASSSASQSPSRGVATPTWPAKQSSQQSGSPIKKPESLQTEEQKVMMKEKPSRESLKEAGENINPVIEKPPIFRSERKEAEEAQEQRKKTEVEKREAQEKKKVVRKDMKGKSETAQGQQKIKETESNQQSGSPLKKPESLRIEKQKVTMKEKPSREIGKEAGKNINLLIEKPPIARSERKQAEAAAQEQKKKTELEILAEQERKKVLNEGSGQKSEADQGQQRRKETEKLAVHEKKRDIQAVGREDATRSRTTRHITAASESTRGPRDLLERKTQNRTEIHTGDNHQKAKGVTTGNPRDMNGEGSSSMSKRIKEDIREGISKLSWGKSNGDEKSVSVFTLTGENRGATMAIASEKDKKDGEVHIHRSYRNNPNESPNTTATETEGERKPFKGKNPKDNEEEEVTVRAYVNGNTQGINNSIVLESSVRENDPGIHMSLKFEESKKEIINPPENIRETVTEKPSNEPRVRRRCLRGLLAESSESEPENPLKPRRHGCRFTCKDKDKENT